MWILFGDGSVGYSLVEFETFTRHNLSVVGVVGNDGGWTQIAREQIQIFKDETGTILPQTDYHKAVEGLGARGLLLDQEDGISKVLEKAKAIASGDQPVLINAMIGKTEFRKGSISI